MVVRRVYARFQGLQAPEYNLSASVHSEPSCPQWEVQQCHLAHFAFGKETPEIADNLSCRPHAQQAEKRCHVEAVLPGARDAIPVQPNWDTMRGEVDSREQWASPRVRLVYIPPESRNPLAGLCFCTTYKTHEELRSVVSVVKPKPNVR